MKRLIILFTILLMLFSVASGEAVDAAVPDVYAQLLPEDCIAAAYAPGREKSGILYAVHGISFDGNIFSVSLMQLALDPEQQIYEEDAYGVSPDDFINVDFRADTIGSYCEVYLVDDNNVMTDLPYQDEVVPTQNVMEEHFAFVIDREKYPDTIRLCVVYGVVEQLGHIDNTMMEHFIVTVSLSQLWAA